MIPMNPWEHQNAIKALYADCVGDICDKHGITRMELDILLFLANNPVFDTATDIIEVRYLSKSQVSTSIKLLEEHGYIRKEYAMDNKKTAHLKIDEAAYLIVEDGRRAQEKFLGIMLHGFTECEIESMKEYFDRMRNNINGYLKEKTNDI